MNCAICRWPWPTCRTIANVSKTKTFALKLKRARQLALVEALAAPEMVRSEAGTTIAATTSMETADIAEDMTKSALEIASIITVTINIIITEEDLTETLVTITTTMVATAITEEARVAPMMINRTKTATEVAEETTNATIARTEKKEEEISTTADIAEVDVAITIVTVVALVGINITSRAVSTRKIDPEATGIIMIGKVVPMTTIALALENIHSMRGLEIGETAVVATDLPAIILAAS